MEYSQNSLPQSESLRTLQDIGRVIRELRITKKLTGVELAKRVKMSQARISRLETGVLRISAPEIEVVLNILDCPQTIRQQILAVLQLTSFAPPSKYRPVKSIPRGGAYKREVNSSCVRVFLYNFVPVILQTPAYRQAFLAKVDLSQSEFARLMSDSERRQNLLWDSKHTFRFIVSEVALYTRLSDLQVHLAQLDRLDRTSNLKQVKFGVIPMQSGLGVVEHSNFVIYDNNMVVVIFLAEEQFSSDPVAIAEHKKVFDELHQKACYNSEAQVLIRRAIEYFS